MTSHVLALIPARGGSKGIPRKNVMVLAGKPLVAYAIEQARMSRRVTRVIVSTEDQEIAQVARQYGAEADAVPSCSCSRAASTAGMFSG